MLEANKSPKPLKRNEKYISKRKEIIRTIQNTSQKLDFSSQTFFSAILYLDKIFLRENMESIQKLNDFILYGLCCLIISAKYNENDPNVPDLKKFISSLSSVTRFRYRFQVIEVAKGEIFCLQNLGYKVNYYSIYQFLSFFFVHGILLKYKTKSKNLNETMINKFLEQIYYVSRQLLNYILEEEDFILVGDNCAIIAASIFRKSIEFLLNSSTIDVFNEVYKFDDKNEKYQKIYKFVSNIGDKIFKNISINKTQNRKFKEELIKAKIVQPFSLVKSLKANLNYKMVKRRVLSIDKSNVNINKYIKDNNTFTTTSKRRSNTNFKIKVKKRNN